jgi:hypothetical protein
MAFEGLRDFIDIVNRGWVDGPLVRFFLGSAGQLSTPFDSALGD